MRTAELLAGGVGRLGGGEQDERVGGAELTGADRDPLLVLVEAGGFDGLDARLRALLAHVVELALGGGGGLDGAIEEAHAEQPGDGPERLHIGDSPKPPKPKVPVPGTEMFACLAPQCCGA